MQNDLIDSVTKILMKTIYDEINSAVLRKLCCHFFLDTIPADSLNIYFILLFSFSKCPLLLIKVDFDWNFALNKYSYIIYQGTDILLEIFSSSPHTRVFVARKLHEGASPRVILSDKHECWTARKNFWRYISAPRYIWKRIARNIFSLGQLYRKFSLGKISA
jgi:hypothetical protein